MEGTSGRLRQSGNQRQKIHLWKTCKVLSLLSTYRRSSVSSTLFIPLKIPSSPSSWLVHVICLLWRLNIPILAGSLPKPISLKTYFITKPCFEFEDAGICLGFGTGAAYVVQEIFLAGVLQVYFPIILKPHAEEHTTTFV
jgi:hypothetical protein